MRSLEGGRPKKKEKLSEMAGEMKKVKRSQFAFQL